MKFRQHWMSIVRPSLLFAAVVSIACGWVYLHPGYIYYHFPAALQFGIITPYAAAMFVHSATWYYGTLFALAFTVMLFLNRVGSWAFTTIEVTDRNIVFRLWPIAENTIPLYGVQDTRVSRSMLGLLLGYGTLTMDSGREEETLDFIPNIQAVRDAITEHPAYKKSEPAE